MAATVTTTNLLEKLAQRGQAALDKAKGKGFNYGNPVLPPGIEGGIAELREIKFGVYQDGKYKDKVFFQARGAVLLPRVFKEIVCEGLPTMIQEALCDTPDAKGENARTTFEQHVEWVRSAIGILMKNPEDIDKVPFKQWESVCRHLVDARPRITFRFKTFQFPKTELIERAGKLFVVQGRKDRGGPYDSEEEAKKYFPYLGGDPLTFHQWNGRCDYKPEVSDDVRDASSVPQLGHKNGSPTEPKLGEQGVPFVGGDQAHVSGDGGTAFDGTEYSPDPAPTTFSQETHSPEPTPNNNTFSEMEDIDSLLKGAIEDDVPSKQKLAKLLMANGVTQQEIIASDGWPELIELMNGRMKAKHAESTPTPSPAPKTPQPAPKKAPFVPKVGGTAKFQLKDGEKPVECEVVSINESKKLAGLKDLATEQLYKGVPWNRLS